MWAVKVLDKVHEAEHMEDLILELIEEAELAYADWSGDYYQDFIDEEEHRNNRKRRIAYERAILECFRLTAMK